MACGQQHQKGLKNCSDLDYWCSSNLNTIHLLKVNAKANQIAEFLSHHFVADCNPEAEQQERATVFLLKLCKEMQ